MEARTQQDRAESVLEKIKPELLKLLGAAPAFGCVSVELVIHNDEISRIISKIEISRKPRIGDSI
jgi:hypothetical protein